MVKKKRVVAKSAAVRPAKKKKKAAKKKAAKKKAAKRVATRTRERRRLVWIIFSSGMKEQARFPYEKRDEAEALLEKLREKGKGKRRYFLQPYKEPLTAAAEQKAAASDEESTAEEADAPERDEDTGTEEE